MLSAFLPRMLRTAGFVFAVLYALFFAGSVAVLGLVIYWAAQSALEQRLMTGIDSELAYLEQEFRTEGLDELVGEIRERSETPAFEYLVLDQKGKRLAGNLPQLPAETGWMDVTSANDAGGKGAMNFRVHSVSLGDGIRLAVGDDLRPLHEIRQSLIEASGWAFLVFLLLSILFGALLSLRFLRRVDAITRTAQAIVGGDIDSRVPLRGNDDNFDRLSSTLNHMLDRLRAAMESLSQVSNDIAHALRTPLSRLQQKLEVAEKLASNSKCKKAINDAVGESAQILDTFSALLRIAQIEAGTRSAGFREVSLSTLLESVSEAYTAAAEDQGRTIGTNIAPALVTWGDKDLLTEMLANLIDNAIRHTCSGAHIEVTLSDTDSELIASVADDGPGIPREERNRVFQRFFRLERSIGTPGNGLGLSFVSAVAELHGIKLSVEDNTPGLRVRMTFAGAQSGLHGNRQPRQPELKVSYSSAAAQQGGSRKEQPPRPADRPPR